MSQFQQQQPPPIRLNNTFDDALSGFEYSSSENSSAKISSQYTSTFSIPTPETLDHESESIPTPTSATAMSSHSEALLFSDLDFKSTTDCDEAIDLLSYLPDDESFDLDAPVPTSSGTELGTHSSTLPSASNTEAVDPWWHDQMISPDSGGNVSSACSKPITWPADITNCFPLCASTPTAFSSQYHILSSSIDPRELSNSAYSPMDGYVPDSEDETYASSNESAVGEWTKRRKFTT
jgi:hypothetical protein